MKQQFKDPLSIIEGYDYLVATRQQTVITGPSVLLTW